MALEDRVNQLENELKVLKNQIQNTLLDIREHLLTNTYPALYSPSLTTDQSHKPAGHSQASPPTRVNPQSSNIDYSQKYPTNRVVLKDEDPENLDPPKNEGEAVSVPPLNTGAKPPAGPFLNGTKTPGFRPDEYSHRSGKHREEKQHQFQEQLDQLSKELASHYDQLDHFEASFVTLSDRFSNNWRPLEGEAPISLEELDEMMNQEFAFLDAENIDQPQSRESKIRETAVQLVGWVDEASEAIGPARARQAVQIYTRAEHITADLGHAITSLIDQKAVQPEAEFKPTVREVIDTLSKFNQILDRFSEDNLSEGLALISEVHFG